MNEEKKTVRVHRVGSITFGIMLLVLGGFFLIHQFFPNISYKVIFDMWPIALIFLGIEILISLKKNGERYIYDKAAIVLMMLVLLFSMFYAMISIGIEEGYLEIHKNNKHNEYSYDIKSNDNM